MKIKTQIFNKIIMNDLKMFKQFWFSFMKVIEFF